jgi:hypothetical protein
MLEVPEAAFGTVELVRPGAAVLYVYTVHDTADLAVLERSPNYLGTDLDVWCWYGARPRDLGTWPPGRWQLHEGIGHDLKRHEFRLPEPFWYQSYKSADIGILSKVEFFIGLNKENTHDRP